MEKNLQHGKTAVGHDPNMEILQFAGDGSLIVPKVAAVPSYFGYGAAVVAGI